MCICGKVVGIPNDDLRCPHSMCICGNVVAIPSVDWDANNQCVYVVK